MARLMGSHKSNMDLDKCRSSQVMIQSELPISGRVRLDFYRGKTSKFVLLV